LTDHSLVQYIINTRDAMLPHNLIYKLSENELKILKNYLNENLEREYIQRFINSAGAPILFVFKKNGELRLYMIIKILIKLRLRTAIHSF
jgi:hypothetical protein